MPTLSPKQLSKTLQRYENKSKSQRELSVDISRLRCLRLCKDTKIKANHNYADATKKGE